MKNILNYYWGKDVFVPALKNMNGFIKTKFESKYQPDNDLIHFEYLNVAKVEAGKFNLQLPNTNDLKNILVSRNLSVDLDDSWLIIATSPFEFFTNSNVYYDQIVCMESKPGFEDSFYFMYSDKECIFNSEREEKIIGKKTYIHKYINTIELNIGWNLIWQHTEIEKNKFTLLKEQKTDLTLMPENLKWRCMNYK